MSRRSTLRRRVFRTRKIVGPGKDARFVVENASTEQINTRMHSASKAPKTDTVVRTLASLAR